MKVGLARMLRMMEISILPNHNLGKFLLDAGCVMATPKVMDIYFRVVVLLLFYSIFLRKCNQSLWT